MIATFNSNELSGGKNQILDTFNHPIDEFLVKMKLFHDVSPTNWQKCYQCRTQNAQEGPSRSPPVYFERGTYAIFTNSFRLLFFAISLQNSVILAIDSPIDLSTLKELVFFTWISKHSKYEHWSSTWHDLHDPSGKKIGGSSIMLRVLPCDSKRRSAC